MVYFTLKDSSAPACSKLVDACHEFLKPHDGICFFAAGTRAAELQREVNDQDFDVALNVVFDTREAQDAYQVSEQHTAFITANKDNWERVRVFDSHVE